MSETNPGFLVAEPEKRTSEDWSDPEYFSRKVGRFKSFRKSLMSLVVPPDAQKTSPTTTGWILLLLSMGIGMAAYNTSSNILFMTLSLLLSSLILSGILSVANFRGTRWRLHLPAHFRANEPARMQIEVVNSKKLLPTYSICFNVKAEEEDSDRIYLKKRLDAGQEIFLDWFYTPVERGVAHLEISGIESKYPFGFLRKTLGGSTRKAVRVWPARIRYVWIQPAGQERHLHGDSLRKVGTGTDLISLRKYRRGDPPRKVHWKASARLRKLMVREMSDEAESGLILYLETAASVWRNPRQFDRLCRLAATLAEDLYRVDRLQGIAINDDPVQSVKRLNNLHQFLDRLSILEPDSKYLPGRDPMGDHVISFRPDGETGVQIYVSGNEAGSIKS